MRNWDHRWVTDMSDVKGIREVYYDSEGFPEHCSSFVVEGLDLHSRLSAIAQPLLKYSNINRELLCQK